MSEALVQLAERCEAATGPNFELEREIADAVWRAKWGKRRPKDIAPRPCTSSLDAALMLVLEGWGWAVTNIGGGDYEQRDFSVSSAALCDKDGNRINVEASTPALALTAAALRALAKEPTP